MDDLADWHYPATVFLSYRRVNVDEVRMLQEQLHVRGVQAWRDETHLLVGSFTRDEIVHAIAQECDAFVFYVTPESLASDFIWDIEVPAALLQREHDRDFGIIPVLRDVSIVELRQCCVEHGVADLSEFNGIPPFTFNGVLDESIRVELGKIAQRVLDAALPLRLRRVRAGRNTYEPSLSLHASKYMHATDRLDLDLNWTYFFMDGYTERWPSEVEWQNTLMPALYDVKDAFGSSPHSRILHIDVHAPLPAAFAVGFVLSYVARFKLVLENRDHQLWRSDEVTIAEDEPLIVRQFDLSGEEKHTAVVELSISRSVIPAVTAQLAELDIKARYHLQLDIKGGPGPDAVKDGVHAVAIARQFSQVLRTLCDQQGVTQLHLFFAVPVEMAVLMGHYLNAMGVLNVYQYAKSQGRYVRGCVLHP